MAEILFLSMIALVYLIYRKKKEPKITQYKFSGANAKEEAARFLAEIDPNQINHIHGISAEEENELLNQAEIYKKAESLFPSGKIELDARKKNSENLILDESNFQIGWAFCAYLDILTPSAFISAHADFVQEDDKRFETEGFGNWLPVYNNDDRWMELYPAPRFGKNAQAIECIPLLLDFRRIIDKGLAPKETFDELNRYQRTLRHRQAYLIDYYIRDHRNLGYLWASRQLTKIKGIGDKKAAKLIEQGIYTIEQYEK